MRGTELEDDRAGDEGQEGQEWRMTGMGMEGKGDRNGG